MSDSLVSHIKEMISNNLMEIGGKSYKPDDLHLLKCRHRTRADDKNYFFVFITNFNHPSFHVKIGKSSAGNQLRNEAEVLTNLNRIKSELIAQAVPSLIYFGVFQNYEILIETAMRGRQVTHSKFLRSWNPLGIRFLCSRMEKILDWISSFHSITHCGNTKLSTFLSEEMETHLDAYAKTGGMYKLIDLYDYFDRYLNKLKDLELPLSLEHGDFFDGNILFFQGCIGVVDWENASNSVFPYMDFILPPISLQMTLGRFSKSIFGFDKADSDPGLCRPTAFWKDYLHRNDLPYEIISVFAPLCIIRVVNRLRESSKGIDTHIMRYEMLLELILEMDFCKSI